MHRIHIETHRVRRAVVAAAAIAGTALLAACSSDASTEGKATPSHSPSASSTAAAMELNGTVGSLSFKGGWVRQPARPEMAAAYVTIVNDGGTDDELVTITSDIATKVVPMDEVMQGGVGSMVDMPKLVVPAHGSFALAPGHAHLMLYMTGDHPLVPGDQVKLTLTFKHNGTVTITLPVKPRSATDKPMQHMTGMTSMSGSASGSMG